MQQLLMMSTSVAAQFIGVTENTLRQSRYSRRLHGRPAPPYYRYGYKTIKYNRAELEAWLSGIDHPNQALVGNVVRVIMSDAEPLQEMLAPQPALCSQ